MRIQPFLFLLLVLITLGGCSEYQKVLKSSNLQYKYEKAIEYYEEEEYIKAYPLFEELIALYRGTERAEKLYYYYAYTDYHLGDYLLAGYRFANFSRTFPNSKYVEECKFMSAYCNYMNSPKWSLDQANTYQAIDELQLFATQYPNSELVDSCTVLLEELRSKLEKKAHEIAKLYYKTENFKSAIVAFENNLLEYPDTEFREESKFLILKSHYLLAKNSIDSKKSQRFNDTVKAYIKFVDSFEDSKYLREAEQIYEQALEEREALKSES